MSRAGVCLSRVGNSGDKFIAIQTLFPAFIQKHTVDEKSRKRNRKATKFNTLIRDNKSFHSTKSDFGTAIIANKCSIRTKNGKSEQQQEVFRRKLDFLLSFVRRNYTHNKRMKDCKWQKGFTGRGKKKKGYNQGKAFFICARRTKLQQLKRKTKLAVSLRPIFLSGSPWIFLLPRFAETKKAEKSGNVCWWSVIMQKSDDGNKYLIGTL